MRVWTLGKCCTGLCWLLLGSQAPFASAAGVEPLVERTARVLAALEPGQLLTTGKDGVWRLPTIHLRIEDCAGYPYRETEVAAIGARTLVEDLHSGLQAGLQCLTGKGPMGRLHPYHEYQAHRLLQLFESPQVKTFRCVGDAMFATAVATSPGGVKPDDPLYAQLRQLAHPGVVLDTFRLGGILTRRHDDETYRTFFGLGEDQILEHRNGQPLRPPSLHRYRNRAGLMFHEIIHWLGHQHSAIQPDLTHLYETCCFGGSDYIDDPQRNAAHRQTACAILRDDELWSESYKPYRQMRLWHLKGYDRLKPAMRADYDS